MAIKNMGYDHAAYIARYTHEFGQNAAGAGSATQLASKFVAWTAMTLYSATGIGVTNGTSTYTAWNGTKTGVFVNGDSFSVVRVTNTSTALNIAPALSSSTYGPYAIGLTTNTATLTGTDTTTGGAGVLNQIALSQTGVGSATASGGIPLNAGDQIIILRGTDATALSAFAIEYGITPLANVTA